MTQAQVGYSQLNSHLLILSFFFFWSFVILGPHPRHMEVPRLRVKSELQPTGLRHSHSHTGSELCLPPTPQLTAMPDP